MNALDVHLEVGQTRTGLWCETCKLPSVIEVDVVMLTQNGVSTLAVVRRCHDARHQP